MAIANAQTWDNVQAILLKMILKNLSIGAQLKYILHIFVHICHWFNCTFSVYTIMFYTDTWDTAQANCVAAGGNLAMIEGDAMKTELQAVIDCK